MCVVLVLPWFLLMLCFKVKGKKRKERDGLSRSGDKQVSHLLHKPILHPVLSSLYPSYPARRSLSTLIKRQFHNVCLLDLYKSKHLSLDYIQSLLWSHLSFVSAIVFYSSSFPSFTLPLSIPDWLLYADHLPLKEQSSKISACS